jgi:hypothetical protein
VRDLEIEIGVRRYMKFTGDSEIQSEGRDRVKALAMVRNSLKGEEEGGFSRWEDSVQKGM